MWSFLFELNTRIYAYPSVIVNYTFKKGNIAIRTRVPHILHPNVGAGGEKQPLHRDEQQAYDVWRERNANKKHRKRLEDKKKCTRDHFRGPKAFSTF